jgi:hypothetical protein
VSVRRVLTRGFFPEIVRNYRYRDIAWKSPDPNPKIPRTPPSTNKRKMKQQKMKQMKPKPKSRKKANQTPKNPTNHTPKRRNIDIYLRRLPFPPTCKPDKPKQKRHVGVPIRPWDITPESIAEIFKWSTPPQPIDIDLDSIFEFARRITSRPSPHTQPKPTQETEKEDQL